MLSRLHMIAASASVSQPCVFVQTFSENRADGMHRICRRAHVLISHLNV
jgi:hypothetical protein